MIVLIALLMAAPDRALLALGTFRDIRLMTLAGYLDA